LKTELIQRNMRLLSQLLRGIVAERYKQLAREAKLSKVSNQTIDPVLFVDLNMQVEREAVQLTEVSLLELVTAERLRAEMRRSALRIQKSFQLIYGDEDMEVLSSESLVQARMRCLQARVQFYNSFLTVSEVVDSPTSLASRAFVNQERFTNKLSPVLDADRIYHEELVRTVPQLHRFLFRKQSDFEMQKQEALWKEFQGEAFRSPQALP